MEALGAVSNITSLITAILRGVEYIQLARTFDADLKAHQLRLDLIRLRLSRWGQATGVLKAKEEGEGQPASPENPQRARGKSFNVEENADAIEDLLSTMNTVLERAKTKSIKMESTAARGTSTSDSSTDTELCPPRFKRLQVKIRDIVAKRYHRAGDHWKGAKWVLYKKDQCEALTTRLTELLDELEKMAVTSEEKLEELGREECDGMGDSLKTLLEVAGQVDPLLVICATQKVEGERAARGVSVSAGVNNGVQMGVNYGAFKGISFGTGNSITNQWGRDSGGGRTKFPGILCVLLLLVRGSRPKVQRSVCVNR
jgi:hypothetical protein